MTEWEISRYLSKIGRAGGIASRDAKTPEERSASAKKASDARWSKRKPASKAKKLTGGRA